MYSLYYLHSLLIRTVQHTVCSTTGILYGTAVHVLVQYAHTDFRKMCIYVKPCALNINRERERIL